MHFETYSFGQDEQRDEQSNKLTIKCGVPQGSILGPLLFIIFINDIINASDLILSLFADDSTAQAFADSLEQIEAFVNGELNKLSNWLNEKPTGSSSSKNNFHAVLLK